MWFVKQTWNMKSIFEKMCSWAATQDEKISITKLFGPNTVDSRLSQFVMAFSGTVQFSSHAAKCKSEWLPGRHPVSPFQMVFGGPGGQRVMSQQDLKKWAACMAPTWRATYEVPMTEQRDTKAEGGRAERGRRGVLCWISGEERANLEPERGHFWRKEERKKNRRCERWWTSVTAQRFESSTGEKHYSTQLKGED